MIDSARPGIGQLEDPRGWGLRIRLYAGALIVLVTGLLFVLIGLGGAPSVERAGEGGDLNRTLVLWFGVFMTGTAILLSIRELGFMRFRELPSPWRTVLLPTGERALFVPRYPLASLMSSWVVTFWASLVMVGGAYAAVARLPMATLLLGLLAGFLLLVAQPHRARVMAGGLWLTPTRIVHEHDGIRWELPWQRVRGSMSVRHCWMVVTRPGPKVPIEKSWVSLRQSGPHVYRGMPVADATYLPVTREYLEELVHCAAIDPAFRASLGSTASPVLPRSAGNPPVRRPGIRPDAGLE